MNLVFIPDENDLRRIEREINKIEELLMEAAAESAEALADEWRDSIKDAEAVDRGKFLRSIGIYTDPADVARFMGIKSAKDIWVESSVDYAAIVEAGRTDANYPGRFPARNALENFDRKGIYEDILDRKIRELDDD